MKGTAVSARYVASYGYDLARKRNINQAVPGPGSIDSRRPISTLGDVLLVESTASSTYHALDISASRERAARADVPRRLHAVEVDGQHVGVPRDRRRRQHAAGQPQSCRRVGAVGLRRPPAARRPGRCRTSKSDGPHSAARLRLSCGVLSLPSVARNADVSSIDFDQRVRGAERHAGCRRGARRRPRARGRSRRRARLDHQDVAVAAASDGASRSGRDRARPG